jgi:hypothetical protein
VSSREEDDEVCKNSAFMGEIAEQRFGVAGS